MQWSTERPTREGWYWMAYHLAMPVEMKYVIRRSDGLWATDRNGGYIGLGAFTHFMAVERPEAPTEWGSQ